MISDASSEAKERRFATAVFKAGDYKSPLLVRINPGSF